MLSTKLSERWCWEICSLRFTDKEQLFTRHHLIQVLTTWIHLFSVVRDRVRDVRRLGRNIYGGTHSQADLALASSQPEAKTVSVLTEQAMPRDGLKLALERLRVHGGSLTLRLPVTDGKACPWAKYQCGPFHPSQLLFLLPGMTFLSLLIWEILCTLPLSFALQNPLAFVC